MTAFNNRAELGVIQDQLLDLLVQQDEASKLEDWPRVAALEAELEAARTRRQRLSPAIDGHGDPAKPKHDRVLLHSTMSAAFAPVWSFQSELRRRLLERAWRSADWRWIV